MKKLGQHFLKSQKIIDEIIKAAELKPSDTVLEVGPGKGILTEALMKNAGSVIAIEKDKNLVEHLKKRYKNKTKLKLLQGDILKIESSDLFKKFKIKNYKIVANIPYYITSRFLRNFLSANNQPKLMVLMLQREVAERIVARKGKESLLSISIKVYGQPKIIKKVPAKYFSPPPKVDSSVLKISNISRNFFSQTQNVRGSTSNIEEEGFFEMVKQGFSSKRKMLKNNLNLKEAGLQSFKKCGISANARAEDLSPENWKCLYQQLKF